MVVWSSTFVNNICKISGVRSILSKTGNGVTAKGLNYVPARHAGHRTIFIRDSKYDWNKLKDMINLYFLLLGVPIGAIIFYCNLFIGPAKLALPPEGYVPKHWEYHEHPISRFLAKYVIPDPQEIYERKLHVVFVDTEKHSLLELENKVKTLMKERKDYQAWYFHNIDSRYRKNLKEGYDRHEFEGRGQFHDNIR